MLSSHPHLSYHMDRIKSNINNPEDNLDESVYNTMVDFVTKYQNIIDDSKVTVGCVQGCITLGFPRMAVYIDFHPFSEEEVYL